MVVVELRNGLAVGTMQMVELLKEWHANVKREEWEDGRVEGLENNWQLFVKLLQVV